MIRILKEFWDLFRLSEDPIGNPCAGTPVKREKIKQNRVIPFSARSLHFPKAKRAWTRSLNSGNQATRNHYQNQRRLSMNNKEENCQKAAKAAADKLQTGLSKAKNNFLKYARAGFPRCAVIGVSLMLSQAAAAQGPVFTGDAGNLSNIIREGLKLMAIVLFCLGAVGIAWGIFNKMTGKEWGSQAFGAILSFAFGTIVAVFWQIAQGRAVSVDTNF
jgi:hypothetical protein